MDKERVRADIIREICKENPNYATIIRDARVFLRKQSDTVGIDAAASMVAGINPDDIKKPTRKAEYVLARALCFHELRSRGLTYFWIGNLYDVNQGSVWSSCKKINDGLEVGDPITVANVTSFRDMIGE